jgi:hypothetical protein
MTTLRTVKVVQDGANFYIFTPGDEDKLDGRPHAQTTYPFGPVKDYDMPKANAARKWFTGTYCPRFSINPQFV